MYNFDKIASRQGTCCEKYDHRELIFGREDIIPMWIADMDFEVAPFISDAIRRRAEHAVYGYGYRSDDYHRSIIDWVERRNGWKIERDWIDFTPGVVAGFVFAIRALTCEGDAIVIQPPVYPPFARMIDFNGRKIVNNPMRMVDDRFEIDFDDLDIKLCGAKALLFCNPHNPTGRVFSREELIRVGELCVKHNVLIISDEIHSDLIQKPCRHTHIASICDEFAERTVTFIAPSKTFNLAGLSTSVVITASDTLRRKMRAEFDKMHADQGNVFGTVALESAYTHGDRWLDELNEYVGGNMDFVIEFLAANMPEVHAFRSEGTYMMWLDFGAWNMDHDSLCQHLVEKAGLGLNSGRLFGVEGDGFMRINLATSREVVAQAMNQLLESRK